MAGRNKLTATACRGAPSGRHSDGGGLILSKQASGAGQWLFRYQRAGRRREMGLGPFPSVSLARARTLRDEWAAVHAEGRDPIEARDAQRRAAQAERMTFAEATERAFDARRSSLREGGHAGRWLSPLRVHILPVLGDRPVDDLDAAEVAEALRPIWNKHPVTAQKALRRVDIVLTWASAHAPHVDLTVRKRVAAILGDPGHVETHVPAMPWRDVPAFYATLNDGTPVHLALRLLILTAARSRPVRFARVEQFAGDVWTIPGEGEGARMKGRKGKTSDFRVPLAPEAVGVVREAARQARGGYLFPGTGKGVVISDMSMSALLRRRKLDARPHGFRSSFRDWCAEAGDVPEHVAEMALGHAAGSKVERAYRRADLLEERARVAERWAEFVCYPTFPQRATNATRAARLVSRRAP